MKLRRTFHATLLAGMIACNELTAKSGDQVNKIIDTENSPVHKKEAQTQNNILLRLQKIETSNTRRKYLYDEKTSRFGESPVFPPERRSKRNIFKKI